MTEYDPRATTRLGKTTIYQAQKEYECEQCKATIPRGLYYLTYSAVGRKNGRVRFAVNVKIHIECNTDYIYENLQRFKDRPRKRATNRDPAPGAGRPVVLDKLDEDTRYERTRIIKDLSKWRKLLRQELESSGPNITRYKKNLGKSLCQLYWEGNQLEAKATRIDAITKPLAEKIRDTDRRANAFAVVWNNDDYYKFGELLLESEEEDLK